MIINGAWVWGSKRSQIKGDKTADQDQKREGYLTDITGHNETHVGVGEAAGMASRSAA
jgi:hypothetical protein